MNWVKHGGTHLSSPYKILLSTRGFESWIFSKTAHGCLGRQIPTLDQAKAVCAKHALQAEFVKV